MRLQSRACLQKKTEALQAEAMPRDEGASNALRTTLEGRKLGEHDGNVVGAGKGDDLDYLLLLGCALACRSKRARSTSLKADHCLPWCAERPPVSPPAEIRQGE